MSADDDLIAALGVAPPEGGATDVPPSMKEIQRRAAAALPPQPETDPAIAALGVAPPPINPLKTSYKQVPTATTAGEITHDLGLGTRNVIEGVTSLPAQLLDLGTYPGRALVRAAGGTADAPSTMLEKGLTWAGLPEPQTDAEKERATIVRGAAGVLTPMGLSGLAARLPGAAARVANWFSPSVAAPTTGAAGVASRVASGAAQVARPLVTAQPTSGPLAASQVVGGGVGAGLGDYLASSDNTPPWLKPTMSLLGNVAGAGGVNAAAGLTGTVRNAYQGQTTPIADALERLRIFPRTVGTVTDNPGLQALEGNLTRLPTAAPVLTPAQRDTVDQFHSAVESTARQLGPESTRQEAGGSVQQILQDWHANTFPRQQDAIWSPLRQQLANEPVDTSGLRTSLTNMAGDPDLTAMPATQQVFGSPTARKWLGALNADTRGGPITWDEAHAIRRQIGNAMGTPEIIDSLGMQNLRGLYGSLAEGMQTTADNAGLGLQFRQANQQTIADHQFIENTLAKAIRERNPTQEGIAPDAAANSLLQSNSAMQDLRERVPQAADALAAYQIRHAAMARPSQQGATDTTSTGTFLTNMRNAQLERPEGTAALYSDPAVAQNLEDLLSVAARLRETERHINTSNSGSTMQLASLPVQLATAASHGGIKEALGVLGANFAAPYGIAKMLTSPEAIRLASTPAGPRPPLDAKTAGLLGYLANQ